MPRVEVDECPTCGRKRGECHKAIVPCPSMAELADMLTDGTVEATDGCTVEPDGYCEHGHSSWLIALRMI